MVIIILNVYDLESHIKWSKFIHAYLAFPPYMCSGRCFFKIDLPLLVFSKFFVSVWLGVFWFFAIHTAVHLCGAFDCRLPAEVKSSPSSTKSVSSNLIGIHRAEAPNWRNCHHHHLATASLAVRGARLARTFSAAFKSAAGLCSPSPSPPLAPPASATGTGRRPAVSNAPSGGPLRSRQSDVTECSRADCSQRQF